MMINIAPAWAWVMELGKQRDKDRTRMLRCTSPLVNPTAIQVVTESNCRRANRPLQCSRFSLLLPHVVSRLKVLRVNSYSIQSTINSFNTLVSHHIFKYTRKKTELNVNARTCKELKYENKMVGALIKRMRWRLTERGFWINNDTARSASTFTSLEVSPHGCHPLLHQL